MEIKTICVVGAGQMGAGIAQVAAEAGFKVILRDIEDKFVQKGMNIITANLERAVTKGKIDEKKKKEILSRISTTIDLSQAEQAQMVIEAVPENEELKRKTFAELSKICPKETILASNTSSIPITRLASATNQPEKVIGMHFMNPVPVMKLVEIIRGNATSEDTFSVTREIAEKMGKEVVVAKDFPGFISNRLLPVFLNEACYLLYEGMGTKEDIDKTAKLALNHPMGPFELLDFIGIDSILSILKTLYEGHGHHKYFPCPLFTQMVEAGKLGRKVGKGFYDYSK